MKVLKRDGKIDVYNFEKIKRAVESAYNSVNATMDEKFLQQLSDHFQKLIDKRKDPEEPINIEEIQDEIEKFLVMKNKTNVVKHFMRYREDRNRHREMKSKLMKGIASKLQAKNISNQNANVDESSFGGRMGEATRVVTKEYALYKCMSKMARENHLNNEIYIHDLDSYAVGMHNCLTVPFDDVLSKGFKTRNTDVRPANSINTAMQLVAVVFQLQSLQQFGGVSASHLDWTMVPYVRKSFYKHFKDGLKYCEDETIVLNLDNVENVSIEDDVYKCHGKAYKYAMDMTIKEAHQAVEGMYHNLNTLQSRSGNQLPFTSINYGTCTLIEGRMIIKELLEVSMEGLGANGVTSIFPCGIFQCMKGINRKPGEPNYDLFRLALKSTTLRIYPNYANVDWSGNAGYDKNDPKTYFSTMGCRTANGADINAEEGVNPQTKDGRGNICPVTIILPSIAMMAKEEEGDVVENFMSLLDKKIGEAKEMLIERFNYICSQSPCCAKFMYENGTMMGYKPEEGIKSALRHGTLAMGQLGLAECLQILIGTDQTEDRGMELAKRIERLFNTRCAEYKKRYKLNFGVYYTPAENLCYTAMKKFKAKYGVIPNVSDRDFFTNSMHVPVWRDVDAFRKIEIESELTGYSNAGCITYVEVPSKSSHNIDAMEELVNFAMDKDIPYFAINLPIDTCQDCYYRGEIKDVCPKCGGTKISRLARVTGYLSTDVSNFNKGKQSEVKERVDHFKN